MPIPTVSLDCRILPVTLRVHDVNVHSDPVVPDNVRIITNTVKILCIRPILMKIDHSDHFQR